MEQVTITREEWSRQVNEFVEDLKTRGVNPIPAIACIELFARRLFGPRS